jgi:hypothetical protein
MQSRRGSRRRPCRRALFWFRPIFLTGSAVQ